MKAEKVLESFKHRFGKRIKDTRIEKRFSGVKKRSFSVVWLRVERKAFKNAVKHLCQIEFPHLAVISSIDLGEEIELIYHFSIGYGKSLKEISINLAVRVPKKDPCIPTICDLIPGALITEREQQEMMGIVVENIPDPRRIFLPAEFPKGFYPWRKDEHGVPKRMIKDLHKEEK